MPTTELPSEIATIQAHRHAIDTFDLKDHWFNVNNAISAFVAVHDATE
jgi:hypothetical protein